MMNTNNFQALYMELEKYESSGISMKLNDYPASPMQIVTAHMVREDSSYMRDYEWDDKGQVRELTFYNILES